MLPCQHTEWNKHIFNVGLCHTTVNYYVTVMSCDAIYRMHRNVLHHRTLASYQLLLTTMTTICCQICLLRAHYCMLLYFIKSYSFKISDSISNKNLISRWDSERELFYDDIVHVLRNTSRPAIAGNPCCSVFKLGPKYNCEARASNI